MNSILNPFLIAGTIDSSTPLILAALAGAICGRVGVFNMALEGQMLIGAFAGVAGSYFFHSPLVGVVASVLTTMLFSSVLAFGVTRFRGNGVVICVSMNLLASGLTAFLLRTIFGVSGTFSDPGLLGLDPVAVGDFSKHPYLAAVLSGHTLITLAAWILTVLVAVAISMTPLGLRIRGVGEAPDAARSLGISVPMYRNFAVILSGSLVGLAGAQLSIGTVNVFSEDMSAGRGWIAMVAVMLARDNPLGAAAACVLFGAADSAGFQLQSLGLPSQLTAIAPYLVTLVALCFSRRRSLLTA